MGKFGETIITIMVAIIGLATLSVIISKNSNTSGLIKNIGNTFNSLLKVTVSPISGSNSL